ncbi:MAG: AAA-like domain-containing protein [Bryobacteraceae bacterium]|nr:AAA-like domain-containing protein [Bryobacteraceae bacterium]
MGRLAEGAGFYGRDEILARAWSLLEHSNLLLLAPRRVGKSSLLHRMKVAGPDKGYKTLYLSVPDAEDELDFLKRLLRAMREADWAPGGWWDAFRNKLPDDLEFVIKTSLVELKAKQMDWRRPAEELETLLKSADAKTLLLIDELPILVGSIAQLDPSGKRAERFLLWLKRLREQFQPRWFFAGSIGLDSVARTLKLSGTIHDLQPIELDAFRLEQATAYLVGRGQYHQWQLDPPTIQSILDAVEWHIPFHLNLVFEELRTVVSEGQGHPSPQLVEVALQRLMKNGRSHFDHWDERLRKLLDARVPAYCATILALACHRPGGVQVTTIEQRLTRDITNEEERAVMLRQLLDLLVSDGYLVNEQGSARFRSSLVRRYWREVQA